jgi:hypothetical protein
MGGGGSSGWIGRTSAEALQRMIRNAEGGTHSDAFDAQVEHEISQVLSDYNDRDSEAVGRTLDLVLRELGKEFELGLDMRFGGSVSKNTYVEGLSDVDALVLVNRADAAGKTPAEIKRLFADRLRATFGRDNVREGTLAVTLTHDGQEIQLLPAVKHGRSGYKIPSSHSDDWSSIRPRVFAKQLTNTNAALNGKLVPTIKLAKAIISNLPEQRQLTGYHTEVLAVTVFQNYPGPQTPKAMLKYFFEHAPAAVRQPRRDTTGQSVYVDSYLGDAGSSRRVTVADAMNRIARRLTNADAAKSLAAWRDLLRGGLVT